MRVIESKCLDMELGAKHIGHQDGIVPLVRTGDRRDQVAARDVRICILQTSSDDG